MKLEPSFNRKERKERREDFGVRWQSAAATPLFDYEQSFQSGVALRFPPQSKKIGLQLRRAAFFTADSAFGVSLRAHFEKLAPPLRARNLPVSVGIQ